MSDAERMAALAELVDSMTRSLDRMEVLMKREHYCSAIVVRQKPGGLRTFDACGKPGIVRRSDGRGFYCAEHARQLLPKPAGRYVTRGAIRNRQRDGEGRFVHA